MAGKIKQRFFYCPKCGGKLDYRIYQGIPRLTCVSCTYVMYENPVVGVAGIIINNKNQILLGRRKEGQYQGLWCIPCGYVEYEEDVYDAIIREFKEETSLDIDIMRVFTVQSNFHNPDSHTVGIWFLARISAGKAQAGDDLDELGFFDLHDIPPLAFPTDHIVINYLRKEVVRGRLSYEIIEKGKPIIKKQI